MSHLNKTPENQRQLEPTVSTKGDDERFCFCIVRLPVCVLVLNNVKKKKLKKREEVKNRRRIKMRQDSTKMRSFKKKFSFFFHSAFLKTKRREKIV